MEDCSIEKKIWPKKKKKTSITETSHNPTLLFTSLGREMKKKRNKKRVLQRTKEEALARKKKRAGEDCSHGLFRFYSFCAEFRGYRACTGEKKKLRFDQSLINYFFSPPHTNFTYTAHQKRGEKKQERISSRADEFLLDCMVSLIRKAQEAIRQHF